MKNKGFVSADCPYCNKRAYLVDSKEVYRRSYGMIWLCKPCDAYVGTHSNSKSHAPLGRLANKELREWKIKAHSSFDKLWQRKIEQENCSKSNARGSGYKWLAKQLNINAKDCHIGMFDVDLCKQVVEACSPYQ